MRYGMELFTPPQMRSGFLPVVDEGFGSHTYTRPWLIAHYSPTNFIGNRAMREATAGRVCHLVGKCAWAWVSRALDILCCLRQGKVSGKYDAPRPLSNQEAPSQENADEYCSASGK